VAGGRATIWVETVRPATVEVVAGEAGGAARTFAAFGHHYAFVVVSGLPAGAVTPYRVVIDGETVWPPENYEFRAPAIHTRSGDGAEPVRMVFGSCREAAPYATQGLPPDALDAYASRLARSAGNWPDLLVLLGDQVYADEVSPVTRRWLRRRRVRPRFRPIKAEVPADQVINFTEYARLYHESWTDPEVRWLLSTVPSVMIFDDHEIIDDWNTSASWRVDALRQPWWRERIMAGLASYWIYQHVGNLDPGELARDPLYPAVVSAGDATELLRDFGHAADDDRDAHQWSYSLDLGRTRLVVLDNRCGRELEPGKRAMLPARQWEWFAGELARGGYDHLVVGASLPWLMPYGVHDLEAAVSAWAESPRRTVADLAEKTRRVLDLEHWPAFGNSFEAMGALLSQLDGTVASASVLSGDVHHSYVAKPDLPGPPIHQLTCSPVHNRMPNFMKPLFRLAWTERGAGIGRFLARRAGLPPASIGWTKLAGPYFGNAVGTLVHSGRSAVASIEGVEKRGLVRVALVELTPSAEPVGPR
jgi:phosphodiesterase/alkaline phosphatase D-like protein